MALPPLWQAPQELCCCLQPLTSLPCSCPRKCSRQRPLPRTEAAEQASLQTVTLAHREQGDVGHITQLLGMEAAARSHSLAPPATPSCSSTGGACRPTGEHFAAESACLLFALAGFFRQRPRATGLPVPKATGAHVPASSFSGSAGRVPRSGPADKAQWQRLSPVRLTSRPRDSASRPAPQAGREGACRAPPQQHPPCLPCLHSKHLSCTVLPPRGQSCWQHPHSGMTENATTGSHPGGNATAGCFRANGPGRGCREGCLRRSPGVQAVQAVWCAPGAGKRWSQCGVGTGLGRQWGCMAEEMGAMLRAAACCSPEAITMGSQSLVPLQVQCQGGSGGPGGAEPSFPRGGGMPNPQQPQTLHLPNCQCYPRACSHCKADPIYKHPKISGCSCDLGLGEGGTPGSLLLPGQGSRILCHCHSNPLTGQKNACSLP